MNISEDMKENINSMREMFIAINDSIIRNFHKFFEVVNRIEETKEIKQTWDVPMNTTRHHQVINRKPEYVMIRNRL